MVDEPIAVVGLGGVFPGAPSVEALWEVVEAGRDCSSEPPPARWLLTPEAAFDARRGQADRVYSKRACFLRDFSFDPTGLRLAPELFASMDPSVHLAVHAGRQAWLAAITSNIDPARVGVVLGNIVLPTSASAAMSDWVLGRRFEREVYREAGVELPAEGRVPVPAINRWVAGLPAAVLARALGLGAGHFTLDAACASSLFALELAIDALQSGRADAMLTGGLSRPDSLYTQMGFSQLGALSPSGHCSPFDAKADGLVVGEGAGILLLKRLSDALRDGDRIRAVVRGVGLSNDVDGNLLAPSEEGQLRAMRAAYRQAGWRPRDVSLIECHATGTPVGDAVEYRSLRSLWSEEQGRPGQCVIGGVKSNVGHLLTGAGAVGLIKTILAMEHGVLPPTANYERPSPAIEAVDGGDSPLRVLGRAEPWEAGTTPRRAAVSGFGFGGTNAHVLLEEARDLEPARTRVSVAGPVPAVAIVGMDAHLGPLRDLVAVQEALVHGDARPEPAAKQNAWGFDTVPGYFIEQVEVPYGELRIPPREIEEALPQQILMLRVATRALADAHCAGLDGLRAGTFIGTELDLNTTNYHLRWSLRARAEELAQTPGRAHDGAWITALCDAVAPALDANRTMGGLGSITASRIARELGFGGPSYTLASEESSGLVALQSATRALQRGQLDCALVGAVDFSGDVRALLAAASELGTSGRGLSQPLSRATEGLVPADGAVALVLKREEDARRDGDRIYAVIGGVGMASGEDEAALHRAIEQALADADCTGSSIDLVEAHGAGVRSRDRDEARALADCYPGTPVSAAAAQVGHAGAASGLVSVLRASLQLYQQVLPASPTVNRRGITALGAPEPWLRNRGEGPRRAGVNALSVGGLATHVVLEGRDEARAREVQRPVEPFAEGLFVVEADDAAGLRAGLERLAVVAGDIGGGFSIHAVARGWARERGRKQAARLAVCIVARDAAELAELATQSSRSLERGDDIASTPGAVSGRVFHRPQPVGAVGELAFVYPGSGSQFRGMGRALGLDFPAVLRAQDRANENLRQQLVPELAWRDPEGLDADPQAVILSQVTLGTVASDVARRFGLEPRAIIGYSLGETAGLFSTGAWHERDHMLGRAVAGDLFTHQLAGPCEAARRSWGLSDDEQVDWRIGVVDRAAEDVRAALAEESRAYLLIVNTPDECVIGGDAAAVERTVERLGASFHALDGVTTVHCEVAGEVAEAYRDLHVLDTRPPEGVRFYSGAWGRSYELSRESAADSILAQALEGVDFPRTIRQAYEDGVRVFVEMGPGASCTRMISKILGDRPHLARSISSPGADGWRSVLRLLGALIAERVEVDLDPLYPERRESPPAPSGPTIRIPTGAPAFGALPISPEPVPVTTPVPNTAAREAGSAEPVDDSLAGMALRANAGTAAAHEAYLRMADQVRELATRHVAFQHELLSSMDASMIAALPAASPAVSEPAVRPAGPRPLFDREQCMELAIGSVGRVLGEQFAAVDELPTRVRLPDEPLMLVDRIMELEGTPLSMKPGRVVTEHDVLHDGWYLDGGRIPTCVAIEAGQADLFLSGYLGVDYETRGLAMYRLLDAEVTFHDELPRPGQVINYDIRIKHFFRQGATWLFRFEFDATVEGRPLMTMRDGCAGFFTQAELDAGKGIVDSRLEQQVAAAENAPSIPALVPMREQSLSEHQLQALRDGDLVAAFGPEFEGLPLRRPLTIPSGLMRLVHRVTKLDPRGGRYGLGSIVAEADIHPDDWFLVCHFSDDQVMPGTLMYECCLHTLRVFLLRMGWVAEADEACWQPVVGVKSRLRCRGQVLASTRKVTYEVWVRELGYGPEPYAICDARMYGDDKAIVDIKGMCMRLTGTSREGIEALWAGQGTSAPAVEVGPDVLPAVYDKASILAFADGKPSDGYGEPYRIFDDGTRRLARLPRPPYQFIDRVTSVEGEPFVMKAGVVAQAQFDIRPDDWFFASNRQREVPFAVLLEAALQACGWTAAYVGSALQSDTDLFFRNLGGEARMLDHVDAREDVLTSRVELQRVSSTAGMIIQHFAYSVWARGRGKVYEGTTYFGFFSGQALADQVGIREADLYVPDAAQKARGRSFPLPDAAPFPDRRMRMVDHVDLLVADGGPAGLGYVEGSIDVDPSAWFFEAHFLGDPVWPGSLGLQALVQLLNAYAVDRWNLGNDAQFETVPGEVPHKWTYRGQILANCKRVLVQASITAVDDSTRTLRADGFLSVDGKPIYEMRDFGIGVRT